MPSKYFIVKLFRIRRIVQSQQANFIKKALDESSAFFDAKDYLNGAGMGVKKPKSSIPATQSSNITPYKTRGSLENRISPIHYHRQFQ